jgi:prefoldin subunit 5
MYKPVIMPCTQEQFETFKDRIPLPIVEIGDFKHLPFLTNNYTLERKVTNFKHASDKILIPYDPELFLECCGVDKKEVVWAGKDVQFRLGVTDDWEDLNSEFEYRLKPKPKASDLDKEVKALQDKAKELGISVTINFE